MAAHKSKNPGGAGFVASNQNTPANDTSTAAGMFELLTRIAVALEKQNQLTEDLACNLAGISNRLEDLAGCIPGLPDSFYKACDALAKGGRK